MLRHFFRRGQDDIFCNQKIVFHDVIACGSFGKVYKGEYVMHKESIPVAIKKVSLKQAVKSKELHNLLEMREECDIVHLYSYTENCKHGFFVVELCRGGDLMNYLLSINFEISERACSFIVGWLLHAIDICHGHGIAHCDVKLENIGLKNKNEIRDLRLLDFGNSKDLTKRYSTTVLKGSPHYIAPELLVNGHIEGERRLKAIDIWCAGIVAYVLVEQCYPQEKLVFKKASQSCQSFIRSILTKYEDRPTIQLCQSHEWLN